MIMAVNPVNSGSKYVSQVQPQPQPPAERIAEKEKAKNNDNANKVPVAHAPVQPTVNTNGQTLSAVIHVKA
jgi:hypothetical protein